MENSLITPEELLNDLNYIQRDINTIQGKRLLVLYLDLYTDYFVSKLYDEKIKELEKDININSIRNVGELKIKATHLVAWNVIEKKYFEPISLIHDLRCKLVHNLKPDLSKLEDEINKLSPDIKENSGLISKFLKNADPWDKVQLYTFPTIYYLYDCLKKIIGEKSDYTLEFHITPDASKMMAKLIKIK